MQHADKFWRDAVMAEFEPLGGILPIKKDALYRAVAPDCGLHPWSRADYIDRAVRQLRAEGKLEYFHDWQGWHVPNFEAHRAERDRKFWAEIEASDVARDRNAQAHHEAVRARINESNRFWERVGQPEKKEQVPPPYVPRSVRVKQEDLIAKLEAKAASTTFPAEAESLRAKIRELKSKRSPV